ncbi:single-stranded DNA-binding protein [uncultured Anaerococcus sp.]|uniref:single-stranded DNA-binding protein n=1 Tax=uncultured Anaerococcus sp. TaxID=293428 RepID=UPI0025E0FAF7|nr:single-stranded DNA-binding protein [uncultured Anaerococcus sp.]
MNIVILNGRLIKDPGLYKLDNGSLCIIPIAVEKSISKEKKQELINKGQYTADIFNILVFNKYGETLYDSVSKGSHILVKGYLSRHKVEKNNKIEYNTNIIGKSVQFLDKVKKLEENQEIEFFEDDFEEMSPEDFGITFD